MLEPLAPSKVADLCYPSHSVQAPLLPGLLTALTVRLVAAEESAMVQSLLCVLAQLLHRDQQQLLDCLAGIRLRWVIVWGCWMVAEFYHCWLPDLLPHFLDLLSVP